MFYSAALQPSKTFTHLEKRQSHPVYDTFDGRCVWSNGGERSCAQAKFLDAALQQLAQVISALKQVPEASKNFAFG